MGFARTCSVALVGVEGVVVEVQADLEPGVAAFTLVGLPDKSLTESRDRVRAAVVFPVKFCMLMAWSGACCLRLWSDVARASGCEGLGSFWGPAGGRPATRDVEGTRASPVPLKVNFLFAARDGVDMVAP